MKYVIAGASTYGVDNMGDDAMLSCLVSAIREDDARNEVTFLARHPDAVFDNVYGLKSVKNLDHDSNDAAQGRIFLGFNSGDDRKNLLVIHNELSSADMLIIGGNSLMEISENTFLRGVSSYATTLATLSLFMGKRYALFGLNIVEPIKGKYVASQAKFLIQNAAIVTVREEEVLNYLREAGIETSNVVVTGDPAYGVDLERASKCDANAVLEENNISLDPSKKIISLCLREEYWKADSTTIERLEIETCKIMRHILDQTNCQILFIPNCFYDKGHPLEDDRQINRAIKIRFGIDSRVHYIEGKLNLFQTLSLFELIYLHISNRRHSNIFAALYGKPFIPVNTSLKTHISSFVRDLEQSDLLVSDAAFGTDVSRKIDIVLSRYALIAENLRSIVRERVRSGRESATRITSLTKQAEYFA